MSYQKLRPFNEDDWSLFSGAVGGSPLVAYGHAADPDEGAAVVVDDAGVQVVIFGADSEEVWVRRCERPLAVFLAESVWFPVNRAQLRGFGLARIN